jgi:uncharacterized protein YegL
MTKKLYAHILLDRSGSMASIRPQTIDAVHEYITGLAAADDVDTNISLTIFDSASIDLIRDNEPVKSCRILHPDEYVPRGMTPLNDAIGKTVATIEAQTRREEENVALVILTDGLENASKEYKTDAIRATLDRVQKEKNWLVLFLGANIDSFAEGVSHRGTTSGHTMDFNAVNVAGTMKSASRSSLAFAATGQATHDSVSFTDEEREKAKK